MAEKTAIEWCDATFNPWIGCTKVSAACDHCYAARQDAHRKWTPEGWGGPRRRTSAELWKGPGKWNAQPFAECSACRWRGEVREATVQDAPGESVHLCPACGKQALREARRRVFCASLADWLDNEVPIEWLVDLLDLVRRTPELDWLLLSKRIGNWRRRLDDAATARLARCVGRGSPTGDDLYRWIIAWLDGAPPAHVWLGATVVTQEEADRDVPKLLAVPARVRFLSIEPMLGPVDLRRFLLDGTNYRPGSGPGVIDRDRLLHWVICGGESGPGARPMHPDWARSLRDQCAAAGVDFMFKQWGEWAPNCLCDTKVAHADVPRPEPGKPGCMFRCGKDRAGRLLDGVEHNGFPQG